MGLLSEYRASWALIRQWAGQDVAVWAGTYDRALTDILRVERELSAEIVNRVREELLPLERAKAREAEGTASRSGN